MANTNFPKVIKPFTKTVNVFLHKDVNHQAPFLIFISNQGVALRTLGPRKIDDLSQTPVYEVLAELESKARENFMIRNFDELELIKVDKGYYASFSFKELRILEDGTYAAYYEFQGVIGNEEHKNE